MQNTASPLPAQRLRGLDLFFAALTLAGLLKLFHVAELNDADFHVYWKAAHDLRSGLDPYAINPASPGFVFKYPPWTLPVFYPLAFLDWDWARHFWFILEAVSVIYCVRWVIRQGVSRSLAILTAFLFWWIWQSHFAFGQFTVMLLAVALWACPSDKGDYPIRTGVLSFILSAKIFSLVTMAGFYKRLKHPKPWCVALVLFLFANGLLLLFAPHTSLLEYYQHWMQAAASGGKDLGEDVIRGQQNHGFTTRILLGLGVSALNTRADMITSLILSLGFGVLWFKVSRPLTDAEQWCGWIALGVITHPLAWDHSFIMAYPLCALALARTWAAKNRSHLGLSIAGTCLIGILVPQLWGAPFVKPIELAGNKCWGVVLAAAALVLSARANRVEKTVA